MQPIDLPRSKSTFTDPKALRALLKSNLGLNARQVTVAKGSTTRWLTITIRDASINIAAVFSFAKQFDTMTIDQTDYCEGQSVDVHLTSEVRDALAAPFLQEVRDAAKTLESGKGQKLTNGMILWREGAGRGFYVSNESGTTREPYISDWDVRNGTEWALQALARQVGFLQRVAA